MQEKAFEKYDALIFTEDDNVFAPAYLDYMDQMLRRFEKDPKVYSIARLTDAVLTVIFYLSGYYSVFSAKSLVRNNGFDGSGVNCLVGAVPDIDEVELDDEPLFQYDTAQEVPVVRKWYLPIPDWAKRSAKLRNDPLTYIMYRVMGRDRYLAWRKRKGF